MPFHKNLERLYLASLSSQI